MAVFPEYPSEPVTQYKRNRTCTTIAGIPDIETMTLRAGFRVDREDGKFYIPLLRNPGSLQHNDAVLRIASDAFDGEEELAKDMADLVAARFNARSDDLSQEEMNRLGAVLEQVSYPGYWIYVSGDRAKPQFRIVCKAARCTSSGAPTSWNGRWWALSRHMTDGEIVQSAFLAIRTAVEHEMRENFKYKEVAIFGPHFDIDKLVEFASVPEAIKEREQQ